MTALKSVFVAGRSVDIERGFPSSDNIHIRVEDYGVSEGTTVRLEEFAKLVGELGIPGLTYRPPVKAPTGLGAVVELHVGANGKPVRYVNLGDYWAPEGRDTREVRASSDYVSQWLTLDNATIISAGIGIKEEQ